MSSLSNGELRWAAISNLEDGSPLGESCTSLIVLLASLSETVQTSGGLFLVGAWQEDETLVDLDAWDDVLCLEQVNKGSAVSRVLEQSLLEEDDSTDSVLQLRSKKKLSIVSSVFLVVLSVDLLETLANGACRLVCGQDTEARARDLSDSSCELFLILCDSSCLNHSLNF